jgi:signal transduction histidine kinase
MTYPAPSSDAASLAPAGPPEGEALLYMALVSTGIGLFEWDLVSDRVRYLSLVNQAWGQPLKWTETSGADWFRLAHPEDRQQARLVIDRAIAGGAEDFSSTFRIPLPPPGEGWRWIQSRGKVLRRDPGGRATYMLGSYHDVTDAVHRQELDQEREAALALALRRASLGALTASFAHEVNQPLAALTSFAQAAARLLQQGEAARPEAEAAIGRTVELAERASEIVRRLRRLARHEPPLREEVRFPDVLHAVREVVAREARAARVDVSIQPGSAPSTIMADRVQVEQLLANLLRNAVEAAAGTGRPGAVVVTAGCEDGMVRVRVADNGPGIRPEDAAHLFDPFFTTKPGGTGLGLTVSALFAEAGGGSLRLEHTGPGGSCFVVELPGGEA